MTNNTEQIEGGIGILYICTGQKYIQAAIRSAQSVRKFCPGLPIHLFANYRDFDFPFDQNPYPFSSVAEVVNPHRRSKVDYMVASPFDRTLYLDTDTALNSDITKLFEILDRFDVAICHGYRRNIDSRIRKWRVEIPESFPQYNSGVFLYKKNPAVIKFLEDWRTAFHTAGFSQDQVTLRELLWLSDVRIATLPPEYNVRFMKYHYAWTKNETSTKIFHLRRFHGGRLWLFKRIIDKRIKPIFKKSSTKSNE